MRAHLSFPLVALLGGGCAFLAEPISDVAKAAFEVPLFGKDGKPASFNQNTVQPLEVSVDVEPGTPATLFDVDTSRWGAVLRFDKMARDGGQPRALRFEIRDLDLADPLDVHVKLSSKDPEGRVLGRGMPVAGDEQPEACSFGVDPETTGEELAGSLDACVTAWVDLYGAPLQPQIEISVTQPGGGQGLHEAGSFQASWVQVMHAENETDVDCKIATMSDDVKNDAAYLDFKELEIAGAGASTENVTLEVYADFYHPVAGWVAGGELRQPISGGQLYWINRKIDLDPATTAPFTEAGNVSPQLSPSREEFLLGTVEALVSDGWGIACWRISGVAPRDGFVALTISGVGAYTLGED